jgi:hypothetical protein
MTEREDYNRMISTLLTKAYEALDRIENASDVSYIGTHIAFASEAIEHARELRSQRDHSEPRMHYHDPEAMKRAEAEVAAMSPEDKKSLKEAMRTTAENVE